MRHSLAVDIYAPGGVTAWPGSFTIYRVIDLRISILSRAGLIFKNGKFNPPVQLPVFIGIIGHYRFGFSIPF